MAIEPDQTLHRFPQSKSIDFVRWSPSLSAFDRFLAAAVHDVSTATSSVDLLAFNPTSPTLHLRSTWPSPSRVSALSSSPNSPLAVATASGSLHVLSLDPAEGAIVSESGIEVGDVAAVDVQSGGRECVAVGEDGGVWVVAVGEGRLRERMICNGKGLVSYTAVKWRSPTEFATGGLGFGVQLWDQRSPDAMVSQLKGNWTQGMKSGIVHSIDIHPSRKHICLVGGSNGTVFAWDLRWQQQPILLSGAGLGESVQLPSESEVWEVQCDSYVLSTFSSAPSTKSLPVMICSEDGVLAVLGQGEEPIELLAENCAINSFNIDPRSPSDVVCALEWESIAIVMRSREPFAAY